MFLASFAVILGLGLSTVRADVSVYGQCGGIGYSGETACASNSTCVVSNPYYSQCLPADSTTTSQRKSSKSGATFTNPIKQSNGADPFMVYDKGYYYLMTTTWSNLQLRRATTINGLKTASDKVVFVDSTASRCCNYWAPEIHKINNIFYIYYTAGPSTGKAQRVHAIQASSGSLWDSTWSYAGMLDPPNWGTFSTTSFLDGTILNHHTGNYAVWSAWTNGVGQALYISKLAGATTAGNAVLISKPTYDWEKVGAAVNEGPNFMYHGGRTFMSFSASLCSGTGYKLGIVELTGSNPLDPNAWKKYPNPAFTSAKGNYQPGHNGFFLSPSGSEWWNVYHSNSVTPGQCDGSRYTNVQPVNWNSDGTPNLGSPDALSQAIPEPV